MLPETTIAMEVAKIYMDLYGMHYMLGATLNSLSSLVSLSHSLSVCIHICVIYIYLCVYTYACISSNPYSNPIKL